MFTEVALAQPQTKMRLAMPSRVGIAPSGTAAAAAAAVVPTDADDR